MSKEIEDGCMYGVEIPLNLLEDIIGCSIPKDIRPDEFEDEFEDEDQILDYVEERQRTIDGIYWIFESINFAFDWENFYVLFERGEYDDEPEDENEYLNWLPQVIINKSGELNEKKQQLIRDLKFKKFSENEMKRVNFAVLMTSDALDMSAYPKDF